MTTEIEVSFLPSIDSILDRYQGFIFDLWGVIHDGYVAYPQAVPLINDLIAKERKVLFLSNAPRPGLLLMQKLLDLGIQVKPEMMLSSGDLVRNQLKNFDDSVFKKLGKRFYHLGANRNQDILADISVELTSRLEEAQFVLLTAYLDQEENLDQYKDFLESELKLKLPLICANPDKEIINGQKLRYCSGFIAEQYEKMGGQVYYYGKPHAVAFEKAIEILTKQGVQSKSKILMIGDTLETDIKGAKDAGVDAALVMTGNIEVLLKRAEKVVAKAQEEGEGLASKQNFVEKFDPEQYLLKFFEKAHCYPNWVLKALKA